MYNAQSLVQHIKKQAKQKNILIGDMLLDCDLNINTLSQISDKKGLSSFSLARIADYLDCSVDYLLGRTDKQTTTYYTNNINDMNESNFIQGNNSGSISIKTIEHKPEKTYNKDLSNEETEILNIYRSLNIRNKTKFLNLILNMEKEENN